MALKEKRATLSEAKDIRRVSSMRESFAQKTFIHQFLDLNLFTADATDISDSLQSYKASEI
jgi:hypothetical protein